METAGQEIMHKIIGKGGSAVISNAHTLYFTYNSVLDRFLLSITYTAAATEFQSSALSPRAQSRQNDLEEQNKYIFSCFPNEQYNVMEIRLQKA